MATKGGLSGNFHHPFGHFPLLLVFDTEGFECRTPPVVSPLVEPAGHRPLQTADLGFQSGVPGDLPLFPQPGFQAYLILNAGRYRRPWFVTRATLGS